MVVGFLVMGGSNRPGPASRIRLGTCCGERTRPKTERRFMDRPGYCAELERHWCSALAYWGVERHHAPSSMRHPPRRRQPLWRRSLRPRVLLARRCPRAERLLRLFRPVSLRRTLHLVSRKTAFLRAPPGSAGSPVMPSTTGARASAAREFEESRALGMAPHGVGSKPNG